MRQSIKTSSMNGRRAPDFCFLLILFVMGCSSGIDDALKPQAETQNENESSATPESTDIAELSENEKAELYISRLVEISCPQIGQPGSIDPYLATINGELERNPPTAKLKEMGFAALPALIKALENDAPTRTVYHWRDFHRSQGVWRVSDFAWLIIREITQRNFGDRHVVGFRFHSMEPKEKQVVIQEV